MEGRWQSAMSTATSGLATEELVAIDIHSQHKNLEHLRRLLQRQQGVFDVPRGKTLRARIARHMAPVVFADPEMEELFQRWVQFSQGSTSKFLHMLLLCAMITVWVRQYSSIPDSSIVFAIIYAVQAALWCLALYLFSRPPKWLSKHFLAVVSTLHTFIGVSLLISSSLCWSPTARSAQCSEMTNGEFSAVHVAVIFAFAIPYTQNLQMPAFVAHVTVLFFTWLAAFFAQFPIAIEHAIALPVCVILVVMSIAAKVHTRSKTSRLQFHMVCTLSDLLQANRKSVQELDSAHQEVVVERTKAVRATTIQEINESIMGYICHQLRNPLHSLSGAVERVLPQIADVDIADVMTRSLAQLSKCANDIWNFQELQKGVISAHRHAFSFRECLKNIAGKARAEGNAVLCTFDEDRFPPTIISDETRVLQLLEIGLSNALKFKKPASTVTISCAADKCEMAHIEVINEGEGLGTLDVAAAFDPYRVIDQSGESQNARAYFGLGLATARLLATLLGGRVGLEDRGKTTVFWFEFPINKSGVPLPPPTQVVSNNSTSSRSLKAANSSRDLTVTPSIPSAVPQPASPPAAQPEVRELKSDRPWAYWGRSLTMATSLRVLIVDDLRSNRLLLSAMLQKAGHATLELEDGDQILEVLKTGTSVDLCMLDIHMVRTDGRDVAAFLREQGYEFSMIAVTGNVSLTDVKSYVKAGFDGVLGKPFNARHLGGLLYEARSQSLPAAGGR